MFALSAGALDVLVGSLRRASGLAEMHSLPELLAATVATAGVIALAVSLATVLLLRRRLEEAVVPVTVAVTGSLAVGLVLAALNDLLPMAVFPENLGVRVYLARLALVLAIAGAVLFTAYFTAVRVGRMKNPRLVTAAATAIPFLLAEGAAFVWFQMFHIDSFFSRPSYVATAVCGVAMLATILVFLVVGHRRIGAWTLTAAFLAVLAAPFLAGRSPAEQEKPLSVAGGEPKIQHVLLFVIDSLRADMLIGPEADAVPTPNLDKFAEDCVVFRNAFSPAPWTLPSMASVLTGVSPMAHCANRGGTPVPDEFTAVAEHLRDAGYTTAAIGDNPNLRAKANLIRGFLEYEWFPRPQYRPNCLGAALLNTLFPERFRSDVTTEDLTRLSGDWFRRTRDKPSFLWLHYFDPHMPYAPPARFMPAGPPPGELTREFGPSDLRRARFGYIGKTAEERHWVKSLYEGEVRYVDEQAGALFDTMRELGVYDNALVILVSDHGEEFWDHGGVEHGHSLYQELLRVPLLIKLPGSTHTGIVESPVNIESLAPTILDLCGMPCDPADMSGPSLASLLIGVDTDPAHAIVSTGMLYYDDRESVEFDEFKYIRSLVDGTEELYHLETDPYERQSVASSQPDVVGRARSLLMDARANADALRLRLGLPVDEEAQPVELDPATEQSLRDVGYLD